MGSLSSFQTLSKSSAIFLPATDARCWRENRWVQRKTWTYMSRMTESQNFHLYKSKWYRNTDSLLKAWLWGWNKAGFNTWMETILKREFIPKKQMNALNAAERFLKAIIGRTEEIKIRRVRSIGIRSRTTHLMLLFWKCESFITNQIKYHLEEFPCCLVRAVILTDLSLYPEDGSNI